MHIKIVHWITYSRYGNALCLLDATYRTTKYALPLFFLAVKTTVGFSFVAEFVVQNETKDLIVQGLQTIKTGWIRLQINQKDGSGNPNFS